MLSKKFIFSSLIILSVVYFTYIWIDFFYIATLNVDFSKYYDYINYFLGLDVKIDFGQGVLYYYLISLILKTKIELITLENLNYVISSSVHTINLFLFIFGLLGIYKLLKLKNINYYTIFIAILGLNFFPQAIYMRAVMKPEILCFAMLPWVLFYLEKFLKTNIYLNLLLGIPFLVIALNTKASAAGMILLYLLTSYYKIFKILDFKYLFIISLVFVSILTIVQFENYSITKKSPFERPYDQEYDYKASPDMIFKFSISEILRNPYYDYDYQQNYYSVHSQSVMNLIIMDTFGDYFNQLFDFRGNYFSQNRKNIFINDSEVFINSKREINYTGPLNSLLIQHNYLRKLSSVFLSILFYSFTIFLIIKDKENRKFYLAPYFGIFILYLNSIGIPTNNFNPFKGDTFKAFYFSFLLCITFVFLISNLLKKQIKFKFFLITGFVLLVIFISGHPKINSQFESERLIIANEYSLFCRLNNFLIFENNLIKGIHKTGNIYDYKSDCISKSTSKNLIKKNRVDYDIVYKKQCVDDNNKLLFNKDNFNVSTKNDCRIYTIEQARNLISDSNNKIPAFAIFLFLFSIFLIIIETKGYEKFNKFSKKI